MLRAIRARDVTRLALAGAALVGVSAPSRAHAQDVFEIQVYEYATVPRGRWDLETHANYTTRGTRSPSGSVAPTDHQRHLSFELTRGITDYFEMAGYLVLAQRPGRSPEYVGYRLRPRVRLPESWLPVKVSLSAEVGFPSDAYEENATTLEIRPVLEKAFGRLQIDLNPVVGRALKGPGVSDGWDFEPGARLGVTTSDHVDLSLEYYGSTGNVTDPLPSREQVHLLFPGFDYAFNSDIVLNVGYGVGLTDAGDKGIFKMRLGWIFGGAPGR